MEFRRLKCAARAVLLVGLFTSQLSAADLVPFNATWNYLDDGSDQGTAWTGIGFDDSGWTNGVAELGYGDGDEVTVVSFGPDRNNKYPTTYFRHTFNVPDPSAYSFLTLQVIRDDGAVVYLNGNEVFRNGVPSGQDYLTFADFIAAGAAESTPLETLVNAALLQAGANVVAVEIHQANRNSSDISFNLFLEGSSGPIINDPPAVSISSPANNAAFSEPADIVISALAGDADGTVSSVMFYEGTNLLIEDTSEPFSYSWNGVTIGSYPLRAVATDNLGAMATSAVVNVSVGASSSPVVQSVSPTPGSVPALTAITVTFSEAVKGVGAADLLINAAPASAMTGSGATYTFTFSQPLEGPVFITWAAQAGISDFENPPQAFDIYEGGSQWQYTLTDNTPPGIDWIEPAAGATVRSLDQVRVEFLEPVQGVNASDLLINGVPAVSVDGSGDGPYRFDFPQPATGAVSVAWAGGHGITDQAAAANPFAGGNWTYTLDTNIVFAGRVVIHEIMYHPASQLAEEEFIELRNIGPVDLNLAGWALTRGVSFVFPDVPLPAGGYLVVAANLASFQAKYPGVNNVIGDWAGRLSNSNEDIELEDADGNRVDLVNYADEGDYALRDQVGGDIGLVWVTAADGFGSSLELRNPALENNTGQNWGDSAANEGTPGQPNSIASGDIPPLILDMAHFPVVPRSSDAVTLTARIVDELTTGLSVTLWYRDVTGGAGGSFSSATMTDDGLSNDGTAGDGVYGAMLPSMANGTIMEFYVEAEDDGNLTRTWPAEVRDGGNFNHVANALYQVDDRLPTSNRALYRLIMTPDDRNDLFGLRDHDQRNVTFIAIEGDDITLRYRCSTRRRGASSFGRTPPTMKFNIPSDRDWQGRTSMNLNSDSTYNQVIGSVVARHAGLPVANARGVELLFNGVNESESGPVMFGLYADVEVINNEWAGVHFPNDPNGNAYAKRRPECGFDYEGSNPQAYINCAWEKQSNASENDWSDLMNLLFAVDPTTTPDSDYVQAMETHANTDLWLRYFAVLSLMEYSETALGSGADDDYDMYRGIEDPRFMIIAHDFDTIFGGSGNVNESIYVAGDRIATVNRFLRHPVYDPKYHAEFRNQLAGTFSTNVLFALFDQHLGDWIPAQTLQSMKDFASARNANIPSQLGAAPDIALATVSGEPDSPTFLTTATLTVGGQDITSYRYRVNNGAFSAETPVGTPLQLNSLADGVYTVFVVGRTSGGTWQADADATASRPWAVLSNLRGVVFNEVLARNDSAVNHFGTFPDMIELFNAGSGTVALGGYRVTDNLDNPNKYTIPGGTSLASGAYLVLLANLPDGTSGLHTGFGLNELGETLYLLEPAGNGNRVVDRIEFGMQLIDRSVGRLANGQWGLTLPSFGSANVAAATGSGSTLKINEWLANPQPPYVEDFVELYNPSSLPVGIGNWFMTDQPIGDPFRHRLTPLSFIDAFGHLGLHADANASAGADHLDFKLSQEGGDIGLLNRQGVIVDAVVYGLQEAGKSEGRTPSGAHRFAVFDLPTPYAGNPVTPEPVPPLLANLIPIDDTFLWRYEDTGADLGISWRDTGFDDSGWPEGAALAAWETGAIGWNPDPVSGVIDGETIRTALDRQPGKITFYFRSHFNLDPGLASTMSALEATYLVDDGAVIYLNGQEAARIQMNGGAVDYLTLAQGGPDATREGPLDLPMNLLVDGDNVIAVEVHQSSSGSSDVVFGLELNAVILTNNPALAGIVLNEAMANNQSTTNSDGSITDWAELYNPSQNTVDLSDMSLTDDLLNSRRWVFPQGSVIPAGGYLIVQFDPSRPASTNSEAFPNTGFGLSANGDAIYFFNRPAGGGDLLDAIVFGIQADDWSIGRVPDGAPSWVLTLPGQGGGNLAATLGDPTQLRVNEWMADPASGDDWFEIFNPTAQPIALGGLHLTDDLNNRLKSPIQALSFIPTGLRGFQEFKADENLDAGADHADFKLSGNGESIGLSDAVGNLIDAVTFGPQTEGVSEGRLPDGNANIVAFPTTPTPGNSNFLPLQDVVVNEVLAHSDPPFEDAIELHNLSGSPVDISGWYLSDARTLLKKYEIPPGTVLPANGYRVFYEAQFNLDPDDPISFSLNSAKGDDVYLSESDGFGTLTGYRSVVSFGPTENGVSIGRHTTSVGVDFTALNLRTFGADNPETVTEFRAGNGLPNSAPKVGPIVINEIMYHPPDIGGTNDNVLEEYVELHNISGFDIDLFHPLFSTNTWRLRRGVDFDFPMGITLPAGSHLLVVSFDPIADPPSLAAFRATYGLDESTTILGPYSGKLDNSGEDVALRKPDSPQQAPDPDAGSVPYIDVDLLLYADLSPWPTLPDGFGESLQRVDAALYGNDPANWLGNNPTPGADNFGTSGNTPPVLDFINSKTIVEGSQLSFTATASDSDSPAQSLTFSLGAGAPAGATIHPSTGLFSWTPSELDGPSAIQITVRVTDNGTPNLSDSQAVIVNILEDNVAPTLDPIGNRTVDEGSPLSFTASASDTDLPLQGLSFSLDAGAPAAASIHPVSGVFTWTPGEMDGPGVTQITVRVTDITSSPLSDSETISITVNEVNALPSTTPIAQQTVNELSLLSIQIPAGDPDFPSQQLMFSLDVGAPAGSSVNPSSGLFRWTPSESQGPSTNMIGVRISDNGSPILTVTNRFVVVVAEINNPPSIDPVSDQFVTEGGTITLTVTATDSDLPAQDLSFSLEPGAPAGASIDEQTGEFTWTAGGTTGTNAVTVRVTDDGVPALSHTATFDIVVGSPPRITSIEAVGNLIRLTWSAVPTKSYQVQYKDELDAAEWTDLGSPIQAVGTTASFDDNPGGAAMRFYQVVLLE